jgi:hypothetical protein
MSAVSPGHGKYKYILTKDGEFCDMYGKLIAKIKHPFSFENIWYIFNEIFIINSTYVSILKSIANENVNESIRPLLFDKETRILIGLGKDNWCKILTLQNPLHKFNPVYQARTAIMLPNKTIKLVGKYGGRFVDLSGRICDIT